MKVKELIKQLELFNPEAEIVGDVSDHCYHRALNVHAGIAYLDEFGQWCNAGVGDEKKIPVVQFIFY